MTSAEAKHHLLLTSGGGCRAECSCGWRSNLLGNVIGAHLAFGEHLLDVERNEEA